MLIALLYKDRANQVFCAWRCTCFFIEFIINNYTTSTKRIK